MQSNVVNFSFGNTPPKRAADITLEIWRDDLGARWIRVATPTIHNADEYTEIISLVNEAMWMFGCDWYEKDDTRNDGSPIMGVLIFGNGSGDFTSVIKTSIERGLCVGGWWYRVSWTAHQALRIIGFALRTLRHAMFTRVRKPPR